MTDRPPEGCFSGLLWEYGQQLDAAETHAAAEGWTVNESVILDSYDRAEHPWMHGRRPADAIVAVCDWWRDSE